MGVLPTIELKKKEDVQDFVRGVTFYGTGGGEDPKKEVAIVGMKVNEKFRTPEGLTHLGPEHFGFEYRYVPIEKIMGD